MINDAQTHELPSSDQGFARLASLMSKDKDELKQVLEEAEAILDVKRVIGSILLIEDLRIQKN